MAESVLPGRTEGNIAIDVCNVVVSATAFTVEDKRLTRRFRVCKAVVPCQNKIILKNLRPVA